MALLPGESLDFEALYNPGAVATHNALVTIVSNDADEGAFTFAVKGTGTTVAPPAAPEIVVAGGVNLNVNISDGDLTPRTLDGTDVGTVVVSEGKERTFRISNSGNAPLFISEIVLNGAPGAVTDVPRVVAAESTADFTVNLVPQSAGQRTLTIRIVNNDPASSPSTFALTGLGVEPPNLLEITDFAVEGPNLRLNFVPDPTKTYQIAWSLDLLSWNRPSALSGLVGVGEELAAAQIQKNRITPHTQYEKEASQLGPNRIVPPVILPLGVGVHRHHECFANHQSRFGP